MNKLKMNKNEIMKHLTASQTDAGSQGSYLACSLCKVQDDKLFKHTVFNLTEGAMGVNLRPSKAKGFTLAEGATGVNSLPTKAKGFTLAEVLITLGIIGVVAAMTIPTLIANTRSQQYRSQFKKTLSTLNQAARMAQAQYDFDFGSLTRSGGQNDNPQTEKTMCALLNGTLSGANYFGETEHSGHYGRGDYSLLSNLTTNGGSFASNYLIYTLADGTNFLFSLWVDSSCTGDVVFDTEVSYDSHGNQLMNVSGLRQCVGYIDVNGFSKPNKEVACANDTTMADPTNPCTVDNASMGDIFPVVFHDGTVEPATNAAAYVLHTAK